VYYEEADAKISVLDSSVLYGDGVYDTFRYFNNKPFMQDWHLNRFFESAKEVGIVIKKTKEELIEIIEKTRVNIKDPFIRIIQTRKLGMGFKGEGSLIVIAVNRPNEFNKGIKVVTLNYQRSLPKVKSLNYLPNVLARREAEKLGVDDAILMKGGYVTEGTTKNIFVVKNNQIYTTKDHILQGITRKWVMNNFNVIEINIIKEELHNADEIFFTGTVDGITSIVEVNGHKIKESTITKKIQEKYLEATR